MFWSRDFLLTNSIVLGSGFVVVRLMDSFGVMLRVRVGIRGYGLGNPNHNLIGLWLNLRFM